MGFLLRLVASKAAFYRADKMALSVWAPEESNHTTSRAPVGQARYCDLLDAAYRNRRPRTTIEGCTLKTRTSSL